MKMLDPFLYDAIWIPKFMRIAECIIGTFQPNLIKPFIDYIIKNLSSFLKSRDGYFLLRTIAKNSKVPEVQVSFVREVNLRFVEFSNSTNGSLLLQSIIHNFALSKFKYIKSCSKHLANNGSDCNDNESTARSDCNQALAYLYQHITENVRHWDNKNLRPVIECCIKIGGKQFENILLNELKYQIKDLILSNHGISYAKLMFKYFESINTIKIVSLVNHTLKVIDIKNVIFKWKTLISDLRTNDLTKQANNRLRMEKGLKLNSLDKDIGQPELSYCDKYMNSASPYLNRANILSVQPNLPVGDNFIYQPNVRNRQATCNNQPPKFNNQNGVIYAQNLRHTPVSLYPIQNCIYIPPCTYKHASSNSQTYNAGNIPALTQNLYISYNNSNYSQSINPNN